MADSVCRNKPLVREWSSERKAPLLLNNRFRAMANEWQEKKHRFKLLNAAKSSDAEALRAVIAAADASGWEFAARSAACEKDLDGYNALMAAALNRSVECVRILAPISPVNAQRENGETALMIAVQSKQAECVKILLPFAKTQLVDRSGHDALEKAAHNGDAECVRLLLPASKAATAPGVRKKAFGAAAWAGSVECMKLLMPQDFEQVKALCAEWGTQWSRSRWPVAYSVLEAEFLRRETQAALIANEGANASSEESVAKKNHRRRGLCERLNRESEKAFWPEKPRIKSPAIGAFGIQRSNDEARVRFRGAQRLAWLWGRRRAPRALCEPAGDRGRPAQALRASCAAWLAFHHLNSARFAPIRNDPPRFQWPRFHPDAEPPAPFSLLGQIPGSRTAQGRGAPEWLGTLGSSRPSGRCPWR